MNARRPNLVDRILKIAAWCICLGLFMTAYALSWVLLP